MSRNDPRERITVLLIDHTPTILKALTRFLEQIEQLHVVGAVAAVDEVLAMHDDVQPHVIVYGFSILVPNSLAQFPRLRSKLPHAFIIGTSFDPDDEGREAILKAGANAYISGFKLDTELVPEILKLLDAGDYKTSSSCSRSAASHCAAL